MMREIKGLSKIFILSVIITSNILFLVSCGQTNTKTTVAIQDPDETAIEIVYESGSTILIPTYYELTQYSDIVIIGHIQSEVGVINSARDPLDNSVPDPRFFTVVQVYLVEVEQYLKGEGAETIYLGQKEGKIIHGNTPSPEEIEQVKVSSENIIYTPLRSNQSYLMFLRFIDVWEDYEIAGLEQGKLFGGIANPWLFDATDQKRVFVVDTMNDIAKLFPPQSLAEIVEQMNNPEMVPPIIPYPAPGENPLYQSQPTKSSYPAP